ncbi:MAG: hypothetical protein AVDCRST_MAG96-2514, partial [uncultured Segetibacter sp.]
DRLQPRNKKLLVFYLLPLVSIVFACWISFLRNFFGSL